ncbi:alpha/beta fold hydrolase [Pseudonocardia saturnea]
MHRADRRVRGTSGAQGRDYGRLARRIGCRGRAGQRLRELLPANRAEHEQVAAREGHLSEYASVTAPALLLRGSCQRQPDPSFDDLAAVLPGCTCSVLDGLDHFGPDGRSAARVAEAVREFLGVELG